jgi:hypothetical protein
LGCPGACSLDGNYSAPIPALINIGAAREKETHGEGRTIIEQSALTQGTLTTLKNGADSLFNHIDDGAVARSFAAMCTRSEQQISGANLVPLHDNQSLHKPLDDPDASRE